MPPNWTWSSEALRLRTQNMPPRPSLTHDHYRCVHAPELSQAHLTALSLCAPNPRPPLPVLRTPALHQLPLRELVLGARIFKAKCHTERTRSDAAPPSTTPNSSSPASPPPFHPRPEPQNPPGPPPRPQRPRTPTEASLLVVGGSLQPPVPAAEGLELESSVLAAPFLRQK